MASLLLVHHEVLEKPGALDDREYAVVQKHAAGGDALAASSRQAV